MIKDLLSIMKYRKEILTYISKHKKNGFDLFEVLIDVVNYSIFEKYSEGNMRM